MARLQRTQYGGLTGAALASSTTGTSQAITGLFNVAPAFATIVAPDVIVLRVDPGDATEEVVYLTAYTAASLNGTITRGMDGTAAAAHLINRPLVTAAPSPSVDEGATPQSATSTAGDLAIQGRITETQVTPPTAAAGTNAGGSPPAPVVLATATDEHGSLTMGTGTSPAAGILATVTLNAGLGNAATVAVVSPTNDVTEVLGVSVANHYTSGKLTSFDIVVHTAPAASQANTVYAADWICL